MADTSKKDELDDFVPSSAKEEEAPVEETVIEPEVPAVEVPEQPPVSLRLVEEYPFDEALVAVPNAEERVKVTKDGVEVDGGPVAQHLLDAPYIEVADAKVAD